MTQSLPPKTYGWGTCLEILLRVGLGGIFLAASADKILNPEDFAAVVRDYRLLPEGMINAVAVILPWMELVLGTFLIAGLWLPGVLLLANLLLLVFWGALALNAVRGIDIGCGCFSTRPGQTAHTAWTLVRDGLFVLAGLSTLCLFRKRMRAKRERGGPEAFPYEP